MKAIAIQAAKRCSDDFAATVTKSDAAYYVKGYAKEDRTLLEDGANGDIWGLIAEEHSARHTVDKVKAHGEDRVLSGNMPLDEYLQNLLADAGAGCMAKSLVNDEAGKALEVMESRAYMIAMRLATLEAQAWTDDAPLVPIDAEEPEVEPPKSIEEHLNIIEQEIAASGHALVARGKFIVCRKCQRRRKPSNMEYWRNNTCTMRGRHSQMSYVQNARKSEVHGEGNAEAAKQKEQLFVTKARRKVILKQRRPKAKAAVTESRAARASAERATYRIVKSVHLEKLSATDACNVPFFKWLLMEALW